MLIWGFVMAALIAAAAILVFKSRATGNGVVSGAQISQMWRRPQHSHSRPAIQRKDFSAVSINCGPGACKAARALQGKRGFPSQIPRLPLSQCDAEICTCTYSQHADRRATDNRRRLYAPDRRTRVERRQNAATE